MFLTSGGLPWVNHVLMLSCVFAEVINVSDWTPITNRGKALIFGLPEPLYHETFHLASASSKEHPKYSFDLPAQSAFSNKTSDDQQQQVFTQEATDMLMKTSFPHIRQRSIKYNVFTPEPIPPDVPSLEDDPVLKVIEDSMILVRKIEDALTPRNAEATLQAIVNSTASIVGHIRVTNNLNVEERKKAVIDFMDLVNSAWARAAARNEVEESEEQETYLEEENDLWDRRGTQMTSTKKYLPLTTSQGSVPWEVQVRQAVQAVRMKGIQNPLLSKNVDIARSQLLKLREMKRISHKQLEQGLKRLKVIEALKEASHSDSLVSSTALKKLMYLVAQEASQLKREREKQFQEYNDRGFSHQAQGPSIHSHPYLLERSRINQGFLRNSDFGMPSFRQLRPQIDRHDAESRTGEFQGRGILSHLLHRAKKGWAVVSRLLKN